MGGKWRQLYLNNNEKNSYLMMMMMIMMMVVILTIICPFNLIGILLYDCDPGKHFLISWSVVFHLFTSFI